MPSKACNKSFQYSKQNDFYKKKSAANAPLFFLSYLEHVLNFDFGF